ncbi:hypothetical protein [Bacillus sp. Marseille-P3661]|uniref:hypothetical protein n=1 Tax=Bacillus sp. Marseille-P3661 TaxID=1936234 RepID=UPI000C86187B|nr:hypothetical protein [Bacillus sp. Marseille-P3661]
MMKRYLLLLLFIFMILPGCSNAESTEWKITDTFFVKEGEHYISLIGDKNVLGLQIAEPFYQDKEQAAKWVFIKNPENALNKTITLKATNKSSDSVIDPLLTIGDVSSDAGISNVTSAISTVKFPSAGIWKVDVYIENEQYSSLVVEVRK